MATRIEDILIRARDTLADEQKERWSDERLLRILDEGHKDLCQQTKILKGEFEFVLEIGKHTYDLPEDMWLILRATYDNTEINLYSYDQMDEIVRKQRLSRSVLDARERNNGRGYSSFVNYTGNTRWETDEGSEIEALIYDNRNMDVIRVYPIPNDQVAQNRYTFENAGTPEFAGDEYFGVVTDITGEPNYTFDTPFGVLTSLYDPSISIEQTTSVFGVTTDIVDSTGAVKIWYLRNPATLASVLDDLATPRMFDTALKHYVVSQAFRDDLDVQYRDMAAESFTLYKRELEIAQETSSADGVRNPTANTTTYRGGFE